MKTYKPESNFQTTDDDSLVYNLRHTGGRKGEQVWTNDVAISITAHHLTAEERADIASTIRDAMNAKYLPNADVDASADEKTLTKKSNV